MEDNKVIYFEHQQHFVKAFVESRLEVELAIVEYVLIKPQNCIKELGSEIRLIRNGGSWVSDGYLLKHYPETFSAILLLLEEAGF